MKIFIWNNPYHVNYGGTFLFVAADTEEQARELARTAPITEYGYNPDAKFRMLGIAPDRPPDRVIEAPGGECYQWSE